MKNAAVPKEAPGASQSRKRMRNFTSGTPSGRWLGPASPTNHAHPEVGVAEVQLSLKRDCYVAIPRQNASFD
jgi:hypothetical protein